MTTFYVTFIKAEEHLKIHKFLNLFISYIVELVIPFTRGVLADRSINRAGSVMFLSIFNLRLRKMVIVFLMRDSWKSCIKIIFFLFRGLFHTKMPEFSVLYILYWFIYPVDSFLEGFREVIWS